MPVGRPRAERLDESFYFTFDDYPEYAEEQTQLE